MTAQHKKRLFIFLYTLAAVLFIYYFFPSMETTDSGVWNSIAKEVKALVDGMPKISFCAFFSLHADQPTLTLDIIVEKNCHPIIVRLAWHDSGTYDHKTKTGGPRAAMRFSTGESGHASNAGYENMTCCGIRIFR